MSVYRLKSWKNGVKSAKCWTFWLVVCCSICLPVAAKTVVQPRENPQTDLQQDQQQHKLETQYAAQIKKRQWLKAQQSIESLLVNYASSQNASLYKLELMYTQYRQAEYTLAAETAAEYLSMYPHDTYRDYAAYMQALSLYNAYQSNTQQRWSLYLGSHDNENLLAAEQAINLILTHHPQSRYYAQSVGLLEEVHSTLAQQNIDIARSYFDRKAYLASLSRLNEAMMYAHSKKPLLQILTTMAANYAALDMAEQRKGIEQIIKMNR